MESQSNIALSCDDAYISLIYSVTDDHTSAIHEDANHHQNLISDDKYAQELQLQEAIMGSLDALMTLFHRANVSTETGDPSGANKKSEGESSTFFCEICAERKDMDAMFAVENCAHQYCTECISKHVAIKLQERKMAITSQSGPGDQISRSFACPGLDCEGVIEIEKCREVMADKDVVAKWDDMICESTIDPKHKYYCPYKDCLGLLVNDSGEVVREAECPYCKRLFCALCWVPWHGGIESCEEFLRMKEDGRGRELDAKFHELAKDSKWQRCPSCEIYVEKRDGCLHMTCSWCGHEFCYGCGATWSSTHGGCQ